MKKLLLIALALTGAFNSYCQTGFYKNFWGTQVPPTYNVPILCSLDTTSDNGYIITTTNQQMGNVSFLKLDSNFQKLWVTTYTTSNTGFMDRAVELDDKGFVGIYMYDQNNYCFTKQDVNGNPQFNNYYHTASSTNFATSAICRSNSRDSGFVVMYSGCILHYGIAKFDKMGDVAWCYDYSANGFNASTYELISGINHGYITCGIHTNSSINHYAAVIAQFDNDGNAYRSKEYILDSTRNTFIDNPTIGVDNHYYATGATMSDGPSYTYDHWIYLTKLDTNLNLVKCWKLFPPNIGRKIKVENMLSLSDSTLIINGMTTDTMQQARMFFIMKFNPKGNGNVVWCKSWISPINQFNPFSTMETGLYSYGANENLVTPALSNYDGVCLVSLDSAGNGLCNTTNESITSGLHSGYSANSVSLFQISIPLLKYPLAITTTTINYQDTILCGTMPNGIHEISNSEMASNLFSTQIQSGSLLIENISDEKLDIEIFEISGKRIKQIFLPPNEIESTKVVSSGIYLIRASTRTNFQSAKVLIPD